MSPIPFFHPLTASPSTYEAVWQNFLKWAEGFFPVLLKSALILVIGWWLAKFLTKLVAKAMDRANVDPSVCSFVQSLCKFSLRGIVLISTASALGVNVASIIAALGAAGLTIGLALKDSLSNFASGIIILLTKPFKTGDFLEIDGMTGTVKKIDTMYTTLATVDNKAILLPNSTVTASEIVNYTAQTHRRLDLTFSVGYSCDLAKAKQVLSNVIAKSPMALQDPAPIIGVTSHNDSSISIAVFVWCESPNYLPLKYELMEKVKLAFDENGIEIPFPQMDVHMK